MKGEGKTENKNQDMREKEGWKDNVEQNIISEEELHGDKTVFAFSFVALLPMVSAHSETHKPDSFHQVVKCIRAVCSLHRLCVRHSIHWQNTETSELECLFFQIIFTLLSSCG